MALQTFYASLAFIIIGVGFLKPSISSIVGGLYAKDDPRRDGGFTIFYMGINLGAMLASLIVGYLGQTFGWAYGFGLAGLGMLAGLVTFVRGQHLFDAAGRPSDPGRLTEVVFAGMTRERIIYGAGLVGVVVVWQLVQWHEVVGGLLLVAAVVTVVGIVGFAVLRLERDRARPDAGRVVSDQRLGGVLGVFRTGRQFDEPVHRAQRRQTPASASRSRRHNSRRSIPPSSSCWRPCSRGCGSRSRGVDFEPSTPAKFGLGVCRSGSVLRRSSMARSRRTASGIVAAGWLALAYLLHTTGELCLSPVGLSMVTKLSVPRVVGLMMGVWFLSSAFSHYVAGLIAAGASVSETPGAAVVGGVDSLAIYVETFRSLAWVAVAVGLVVLALSPLVRRFMHESAPRS